MLSNDLAAYMVHALLSHCESLQVWSGYPPADTSCPPNGELLGAIPLQATDIRDPIRPTFQVPVARPGRALCARFHTGDVTHGFLLLEGLDVIEGQHVTFTLNVNF